MGWVLTIVFFKTIFIFEIATKAIVKAEERNHATFYAFSPYRAVKNITDVSAQVPECQTCRVLEVGRWIVEFINVLCGKKRCA